VNADLRVKLAPSVHPTTGSTGHTGKSTQLLPVFPVVRFLVERERNPACHSYPSPMGIVGSFSCPSQTQPYWVLLGTEF
jgi:hypothetical protein